MRFPALSLLVALVGVACTQITEVDWTKVPGQGGRGGEPDDGNAAGTSGSGAAGAGDENDSGASPGGASPGGASSGGAS